ncbi:MAG: Hsp20/alpha crystallin family protein [Methylomonas sp.]|jgi:HSP20 family protein|uniref:Hsp20/alpha crystallin family protein n=1 Tax=Methylomonas sp. TaxID=418 RepID=UPI0025D299F4|nr:Hsp20/alpha crystallin family protein [Methylomonas sp.]MCK9607090.1 Hsp20/alpha crystallin family protein [Methylomonas sp.]
MSTTEKEIKKSTELSPSSLSGGLFSLNERDNFFDDFLLRKWPRLLDWNFSAGFEKAAPKVDILDHDAEIEVQAALPGVGKDNLDVTINNQTSTIRAAAEQESKAGMLKVLIPKTEQSKHKTIEITD